MKKSIILAVVFSYTGSLQAQNVGIGTVNPRFPLSLNTTSGDKISLYDDGNPAGIHFGLGVYSGGLFQLYAATINDDIAFGIGNSSSFTERMRIKGNGNIGINTSNPVARLHIADSNVVFTGPVTLPGTTTFDPALQGAGTRMLWYPQKAAFRAGNVDGVQWNKDNIGNYSFASGRNTKAIGQSATAFGHNTTAAGGYSTAMGSGSTATGDVSFAIGYGATASGHYSAAIGWSVTASGSNSFAIGTSTVSSGESSITAGYGTSASGYSSVAMGYNNVASGNASVALGENTDAIGHYSTAMGFHSFASGAYSTVMGIHTIAKATGGTSVGLYNDDTDLLGIYETERIFQIGNGNSFVRSNALTILRNGNMGIGTTTPFRPLSFPAAIGEKILLYPGANGEVGIGVYGNELRLHCDNPGSKVSFGTQTNAGLFTEAGKFEIAGVYALSVFGSIWANGATYASDERFKQNITAIQSPLQKLIQINGVEYEMKADEFAKNHFPVNRQMGLLAQNVEKIVPEAVNEMDGYKGVDYARLVPLLIESIKEQQKQIEELKSIIKKLPLPRN